MANGLINVELFKAGVEGKFGANRKMAQFVESESAEGLQVHTVNIATNDYIGDATVVAPGAEIPVTDMKQTKTPVTFEKLAKGVKVTDEELKQTFGDVLGNAENQTVKSIESAMEAKIAGLFDSAKFSVEYEGEFGAPTILSAIGAFGEAYEDAENYLLVNPKDFANLQADIKAYDNTTMQGLLYGAKLVMSTRITEGEAVLIQKGAIKELVQKDVDVEPQRDASTKSTKIFTDKIYAVYIQDQSKLLVIKPTV
ncbi:hypothetical protein MXL49_16695 [Enterococcus casseliflavus]|uniref:phage major capsid protein n=1 Tax=Enterococcus casseliflavus TaxID=37734 RepID=UPI002DBEE8BD|nr:hypothetical protein [Enterococcus casseliflavus]MEB6213521.1 hypothetical protein [Enterococcus casseliflavus]